MIYLVYDDGTATALNGHAEIKNDVASYSYHIPFTASNYARSLGLKLQEITLTGFVKNKTDIPWDHIQYISFDDQDTLQKVFVVGGVNFGTVPPGFWIPFSISLLVSPLRIGTYQGTSSLFGYTSTTLTQYGNYTAYAGLTYYAPRFFFPLKTSLIDFAGRSLTFTNPNSKTYNGVSYPANTPIFDNGLYLGNSSDVVQWTPYNSTTQTIALQIRYTGKSYPSPWVVGGSGGNLLTANQSSAETDTSGMSAVGGTLSRTTTAGEYYAGTAGFKVVADGSQTYAILYTNPSPSVVAGQKYCFSAYVKASAARNVSVYENWNNGSSGFISRTYSAVVPASTSSFTRLFVIDTAPAGAASCTLGIKLDGVTSGDVLYVDNLMFEVVDTTSDVTIWDDGSTNKLFVDTTNNLLKWTDYTSTIQCTFPADQFFGNNTTRQVVTIVAIHNGATKEIHCKYEGGTWYNGSGTLNNLVWTNTLTLGRFDGVLFNLVQYDYVLTPSQYSALNFTTNPLRWNNLYIANKTPGKITYKDGILTDENGNDITGLVSGQPIELPPSTPTTIQMLDGLSAKWDVFTNDTFYP
jgi:hypothetical protein